jgi:hypothetical protein
MYDIYIYILFTYSSGEASKKNSACYVVEQVGDSVTELTAPPPFH